MSPSVHQRERRERAFELKFCIPDSLAQEIRTWMRRRLLPDPHGTGPDQDEYTITSLYFDTPALDVFHRNGSYGRSKFRIRRYGLAESLFLERKLKTRGLVSKRRSRVAPDELSQLRAAENAGDWIGVWYRKRLQLRQLAPVCQIRYRRVARYLEVGGNLLRLTVDDSIQARRTTDYTLDFHDGNPVLDGDRAIVEMKYIDTLPVLLKEVVETFALSPQALSKYRTAAAVLGMASLQSGTPGTAAAIPILSHSSQPCLTC